jgi:hypothetical protein
MLACIVRCTAADPGRMRVLLVAAAGCLTLASFAGGFATSRYCIDRELADSTRVLNRSAHAYEAEQALLFEQWANGYAQLAQRIAADRSDPSAEGGPPSWPPMTRT